MTTRILSAFALLTGAASLLTGCAGAVGGGGPSVSEVGPVHGGIGSYVVADTHSGHVVLSHAPEARRPVASLTKIATAVAVLDYVRHAGMDAGQLMTVPPQVQTLGDPGPVHLQAGDQLSIRDGLYAAMMSSDNYAAETLAAHIGTLLAARGAGGNPMSAFVNQMNALARRAGLDETRFANAHGLELEGQRGYSTAADMARLAIHALNIPGFTFYCSQKTRSIRVLRGGQTRSLSLHNTNELLGKGRIDGVKTGTTSLAGPCLILTAPRPATVNKRPDGSTVVIPHRLVVVELGASDRFNQGWMLLQQGWAAYDQWRASGNPATQGTSLFSTPPAAPHVVPATPAPAPAAPTPAAPPAPADAAPSPFHAPR